MNIIFGAFLLLFAIGSGIVTIYTPTFMKQMQTTVKAEQDREKTDRETKIADLKKQEAEAKTEEEKRAWRKSAKTSKSRKRKRPPFQLWISRP